MITHYQCSYYNIEPFCIIWAHTRLYQRRACAIEVPSFLHMVQYCTRLHTLKSQSRTYWVYAKVFLQQSAKRRKSERSTSFQVWTANISCFLGKLDFIIWSLRPENLSAASRPQYRPSQRWIPIRSHRKQFRQLSGSFGCYFDQTNSISHVGELRFLWMVI